jgi:hypothetical protein
MSREPDPARPGDAVRPYAYEITIRRYDGTEETITRVARTRREAERVGLRRPQAEAIVRLVPMTRRAYQAWYGHQDRR